MDALRWALQLLLAGMFLVAAIAKLGDDVGLKEILGELGVPERLQRAVHGVLPWLELATALLLMHPATTRLGAAAAALMLAMMTCIVACALARGKHPACNCFGEGSTRPIGWNTVLRNTALTGCALMLVWLFPSGGAAGPLGATLFPSSGGQEDPMVVSLLFFLAGCLGWLVFHQFRQNGRLLLRMDMVELRLQGAGIADLAAAGQPPAGLPVGTLAPDFVLPRLDGSPDVTLRALTKANIPQVLVFSDVACAPCKDLLPAVLGWQQEYAGLLQITLIVHDEANRLRAGAGPYPGESLVQATRQVSQLYQALATPSAVLIGANGTIQSPLAIGAQQISLLVSEASRTPAGRAPRPLGAFA